MWIMNICIYCLALNRSVWYIWTMKSERLRRYNSFIAFHPAVVVDVVLLWELCECVCVWQAMFVSVASLFHSLSNIHSHPSQSLNRPAMKHKSDVFFVPNNQINQTAGPCTPWLHIIFWKEQIWKPIWFRTYWLHFYSLPIFNEKREIMGAVKPIERLDVLGLLVLMKFQTHLEWKQTNRTV